MSPQVRADAVLPFGADRARAGLWRVLVRAGGAAETEFAVELPLVVGPGRRFLRKRVLAQVVAPRSKGRTHVFHLRWAATGALAFGYPVLEARVGVTDVDETTSLLSLVGDYVPPFGWVGGVMDRAGLWRLADATAEDITERLAQAVKASS